MRKKLVKEQSSTFPEFWNGISPFTKGEKSFEQLPSITGNILESFCTLIY